MSDSEPVALIKACGIYIVVVAEALPIPNVEVISRHQSWGAAHEARQRLQGGRKAQKRTIARQDEYLPGYERGLF